MVNYTLKEKILKFLIENKEPHSIKGIATKLNTDYKNTFQAIKDLEKLNLISKTKIGNINLIKIKLFPNKEIISLEYKRTKEFLSKNLKIKLVKKYIDELNYPFLISLVFGSYAKATKIKSSDIDICIILDNKEKSKELHNKLNLLSLKLEIQEFTTKEFISMIEKKENNLGNEIVKNNILLYGIENYYNLIEKWMN